jgi:hypothetical protein
MSDILASPDDFATATHNPDIAGATRDLMRGAVCYHTHVGWIRRIQSEPCRTILDPETAVRSAAAAGMRAILLRDLYCNSAGMAAILQPHVPDIQILGGIFLNSEVGGVNPYAVDTAMSYGNGAKFVCLATDSAAHSALKDGVPPADVAAEPIRYVTPFDEGKLKPEMYRVLELVAQHDILLETGTLAPEEILTMIKEAKQVGVNKIVVTHPSPGFVGMTIEQQVCAADLGAYVEYAWIFYTYHSSFRSRRYPEYGRLATLEVGSALDEIRAVGAERCILSTDLGQLDQPLPVEGLREFVFCLLELGLPPRDIARMIRDNPSYLLGLDE